VEGIFLKFTLTDKTALTDYGRNCISALIHTKDLSISKKSAENCIGVSFIVTDSREQLGCFIV
jgi:hypothetical protein